MVSIETMVEKFPRVWQGLFGAMCDTENSLASAEYWYRQNTESEYGERLEWVELIEALTDEEPAIQSEKMVFCPRLLCFPRHLQRTTVAFLHQHRGDIPIRKTKKFLQKLQHRDVEDSWVSAMLKLFHVKTSNLQETVSEETESLSMKNQTFNSDAYTFTVSNQGLYDRICHKMRTANSQVGDTASGVKEMEKKDGEKGLVEDMETDNEINNKPTEIDIETEKMEVVEQHPGVVADVHIVTMETEVNSSHQDVADVTEPIDKPSRDAGKTAEICGSSLDSLDVDIKADIIRLKEILRSDEEVTEIPKEAKVLSKCNVDQMEFVCKHLDLLSYSDSATASVYQWMCSLAAELSYSNCLCFARICILEKVLSLHQSASRVLLSALTSFASKFPKQMIEGVCVPLLSETSLAHPQADLIIKIIKGSLSGQHQKYLLGEFTHCCPSLSEPGVMVLHTLLECKLDISSPEITSVLALLERSAPELCKSLKFGKLLMVLINCYGKQLSISDKQVLGSILSGHNTFMKKTGLAALKKMDK